MDFKVAGTQRGRDRASSSTSRTRGSPSRSSGRRSTRRTRPGWRSSGRCSGRSSGPARRSRRTPPADPDPDQPREDRPGDRARAARRSAASRKRPGAKIDIEDSGIVMLSSLDAAGAEAARDKIQAMTEGVQVGQIYEGRVTSIKDFGAFVEILPGKDGLVHISEMSEGYVSSVNDICRVGDPMLVKAISVDDQDRVKLSRKAALAERGEVDDCLAARRPPPAAATRGPGRRSARRPAATEAVRGGGAIAGGGTGGSAATWRRRPRWPPRRPRRLLRSGRPTRPCRPPCERSRTDPLERAPPDQSSGNRRDLSMANLCPARSRTPRSNPRRQPPRQRSRRRDGQGRRATIRRGLAAARPPRPAPVDAEPESPAAPRPVRRDRPARRRPGA